MNIKGLILIGVAVVGSSPAWASYRSMNETWTGYAPNQFYQDNAAARAPVEPAPAPDETGFQQQIEALRRQKQSWSEALAGRGPEPGFYRPDPARLEALSAAGADPSLAGEQLTDGYDLATLEALTWLRNPSIAAEAKRLRATLETYEQVWNLDDILRQYSAFTEELMTGVGPTKGRDPVRLRFPFPGVLSLKGDIAEQEVRTARETLEATRRNSLTAVRKTYWNLLYIHSAQDITDEMLGLLRHLEAVAKTRYEAGATSFQDVIKVRIQRETVEEDLQTLVERQGNLEIRLREMLDLAPDIPVGTPATAISSREFPAPEALYATALERNQELRKMRIAVRKMELMIEMAETRLYPAYTLNLSLYSAEEVTRVGTARVKEPFSVATTAGVGAGLPKMPWYGTNDAYLRETRQKLEALRRDVTKMEDETVTKVRARWFHLDRALREEQLYGESVVDLSQAALDVSSRGYETGGVTFADVITSYTNWLDANLALERRRSDLGVALAELESSVGVSPLPTSAARQ